MIECEGLINDNSLWNRSFFVRECLYLRMSSLGSSIGCVQLTERKGYLRGFRMN
jgi:hypothetical protein